MSRGDRLVNAAAKRLRLLPAYAYQPCWRKAAEYTACYRCGQQELQAQKERQGSLREVFYAEWKALLTPHKIRETCRKRFGIETSYRQMNDADIRTYALSRAAADVGGNRPGSAICVSVAAFQTCQGKMERGTRILPRSASLHGNVTQDHSCLAATSLRRFQTWHRSRNL
jgi:hypothetical protein